MSFSVPLTRQRAKLYVQRSWKMMPRERTELLGQDTLPGNSLGLNPIENLLGIVKTQLNEAESCSSVEQLTAMTKSTWASILLSALRCLASADLKKMSRRLSTKLVEWLSSRTSVMKFWLRGRVTGWDTKTHLPPKFSVSSDFDHFILKMLKNAYVVKVSRKDTAI